MIKKYLFSKKKIMTKGKLKKLIKKIVSKRFFFFKIKKKVTIKGKLKKIIKKILLQNFFFNDKKKLNIKGKIEKKIINGYLKKMYKIIKLVSLSLIKKKKIRRLRIKIKKVKKYKVLTKVFVKYLFYLKKIPNSLKQKIYIKLLRQKYILLSKKDYFFIRNFYNYKNKRMSLIDLLNFFLYLNNIILKKKKKRKFIKKYTYILGVKRTLNNLFSYIYIKETKKLICVGSLGQAGLKGPAKLSQVSSEFLGRFIADKCRKAKIKEVIVILNTKYDFYVKTFFKGFSKMTKDDKNRNKKSKKRFIKKKKIYDMAFVVSPNEFHKQIKINSIFFLPKFAHNGNRLKNARRR